MRIAATAARYKRFMSRPPGRVGVAETTPAARCASQGKRRSFGLSNRPTGLGGHQTDISSLHPLQPSESDLDRDQRRGGAQETRQPEANDHLERLGAPTIDARSEVRIHRSRLEDDAGG